MTAEFFSTIEAFSGIKCIIEKLILSEINELGGTMSGNAKTLELPYCEVIFALQRTVGDKSYPPFLG